MAIDGNANLGGGLYKHYLDCRECRHHGISQGYAERRGFLFLPGQ